MTPAVQGTVKESVSFKGKGLHTGKHSEIIIHPADEDSGIVFRRIDKAGRNTEVTAHWKNTKQLPLCTCIASSNNIHIRTIEHLMAAFYACGIDNALVDVNGTELPILDGSAAPYVLKLNQAGITKQKMARHIFRVTRKLEIDEGNRHFIIEPADKLSIDVTVLLKQIGRKHWSGEINPSFFAENISSARTFGRLQDGILAQLSRFSKTPICLGANTKSVIVIGRDNKVLNKEGLRMPDEFIKHRILDLVGDLMLSGGHIQGKITTLGPVHRLTHDILRKIFEEEAATEDH
jgi:UDP-3-O-[3-hydroxymyristoyl] N-acetylglucosamine deacetylase